MGTNTGPDAESTPHDSPEHVAPTPAPPRRTNAEKLAADDLEDAVPDVVEIDDDPTRSMADRIQSEGA
jgi:hypothetical protein